MERLKTTRMDGRWLDNRTGSLIAVHARLLRVTTNNPPCLVSREGTIGIELMLEDPFVSDHISAMGVRDKGPCVVIHEGPGTHWT